jgi:hypothetical protein
MRYQPIFTMSQKVGDNLGKKVENRIRGIQAEAKPGDGEGVEFGCLRERVQERMIEEMKSKPKLGW